MNSQKKIYSLSWEILFCIKNLGLKNLCLQKKKIATNVLTKKLNILLEEGFIKKLTALGTKKVLVILP